MIGYVLNGHVGKKIFVPLKNFKKCVRLIKRIVNEQKLFKVTKTGNGGEP